MKQAKRVQMTAVVTTTKTSGVLDEIVIGDWLHVELLDEARGRYFLRVGQYTFDVIVPYTGTSVETRLQCAPLPEEDGRYPCACTDCGCSNTNTHGGWCDDCLGGHHQQ